MNRNYAVVWIGDVAQSFSNPHREIQIDFGPPSLSQTGYGQNKFSFRDEGKCLDSNPGTHASSPFRYGWKRDHRWYAVKRGESKYAVLDDFVSSRDGQWTFRPLLPGAYRLVLAIGDSLATLEANTASSRSCTLWLQERQVDLNTQQHEGRWTMPKGRFPSYVWVESSIVVDSDNPVFRMRIKCDSNARASSQQWWECSERVREEIRTGLKIVYLTIQPLDWSVVELYDNARSVVATKDREIAIASRSALRRKISDPFKDEFQDDRFVSSFTHTLALFGSPNPATSTAALERTLFNWIAESRAGDLDDDDNDGVPAVLLYAPDLRRLAAIKKRFVESGVVSRASSVALSRDFESFDQLQGRPPTYRGLFDATLRDLSSVSTNTRLYDFIAYANVDILFADMRPTLEAVYQFAKENGYDRVFVTGRRTDVRVCEDSGNETDRFFGASAERMRTFVRKARKRCGSNMNDEAQDYFIVTPQLWTWNELPPFVLGGIAVDNWLVSQAVSDDSILTVDATETLTCIHQDHRRSRSSRNARSEHNKRLARKSAVGKRAEAGAWYYGRTSDMRFFTEWSTDDDVRRSIVVRRREHTRVGSAQPSVFDESAGSFSSIAPGIRDAIFRIVAALFALIVVAAVFMTAMEVTGLVSVPRSVLLEKRAL